jgi:hypothetical protein
MFKCIRAYTKMRTELKQNGSIILLLTLLLTSVSEDLWAQPETLNSDKGRRSFSQGGPGGRTTRGARAPERVELSTGFVFLNGQYVFPPYTIAVAGNEISLNGVVLPPPSLTRSNQRTQFQRRGGRMPSQRQVAWLKQNLAQDGLLIHLDEKTMALIPGYRAVTILDTLLSSESPDYKVQALDQEELTEFSSIQWAALVDGFEASPELLDRVAILRETLGHL